MRFCLWADTEKSFCLNDQRSFYCDVVSCVDREISKTELILQLVTCIVVHKIHISDEFIRYKLSSIVDELCSNYSDGHFSPIS